MTKTITALLISTSLLFAACGSDDADEGDLSSTIKIINGTSFSFVEMNLSPIDIDSWGPDLLEADIMEPGDVLELSGIPCDTYDIRFIDEDADECIIDDIDICLANESWTIDDAKLAVCIDF